MQEQDSIKPLVQAVPKPNIPANSKIYLKSLMEALQKKVSQKSVNSSPTSTLPSVDSTSSPSTCIPTVASSTPVVADSSLQLLNSSNIHNILPADLEMSTCAATSKASHSVEMKSLPISAIISSPAVNITTQAPTSPAASAHSSSATESTMLDAIEPTTATALNSTSLAFPVSSSTLPLSGTDSLPEVALVAADNSKSFPSQEAVKSSSTQTSPELIWPLVNNEMIGQSNKVMVVMMMMMTMMMMMVVMMMMMMMMMVMMMR